MTSVLPIRVQPSEILVRSEHPDQQRVSSQNYHSHISQKNELNWQITDLHKSTNSTISQNSGAIFHSKALNLIRNTWRRITYTSGAISPANRVNPSPTLSQLTATRRWNAAHTSCNSTFISPPIHTTSVQPHRQLVKVGEVGTHRQAKTSPDVVPELGATGQMRRQKLLIFGEVVTDSRSHCSSHWHDAGAVTAISTPRACRTDPCFSLAWLIPFLRRQRFPFTFFFYETNDIFIPL